MFDPNLKIDRNELVKIVAALEAIVAECGNQFDVGEKGGKPWYELHADTIARGRAALAAVGISR